MDRYDNYYETAVTNFTEAAEALKRAPGPLNPTLACMIEGLRHLVQGLLQERKVMEERLSEIVKNQQPR